MKVNKISIILGKDFKISLLAAVPATVVAYIELYLTADIQPSGGFTVYYCITTLIVFSVVYIIAYHEITKRLKNQRNL